MNSSFPFAIIRVHMQNQQIGGSTVPGEVKGCG